ncbi:MAG: SIR2 family protein [Acidobacteriota bacterium]|nr:SIR2 family protein [Acidobacteriota bacterium]
MFLSDACHARQRPHAAAPGYAPVRDALVRDMISPIESLAFSIHANPGVYAVLAGSGLSRAARIPTGWEITLDLVQKLAAVREEHCDPDPEQWYRNAFGKEPDYSDLLNAVCKTPAERQQLLQSYVEPSDEQREEGAKQPTTAHRAIAALAAQGFIRVIVTTNFDRLFETALEAATVTPVVVSTPDQVRGALPLIHTSCYVVKLHGDYRDSRILNTEAELNAYDQEFDRLLDRIFDEFGLVVCGWSAAWDAALRKALFRAPSRRFTTYWAARGELGDEARRLVEHRGAELIRINDADKFFHTVQQHVESLRESDRPHPMSTAIAVASLKRYLADSRHRIRLSDLIDDTVEEVVNVTSSEELAGNPTVMDAVEVVAARMRGVEAACSKLVALAVTGGFWAQEERQEHIRPWERALVRLGSQDWPAGDFRIDLQRYPAMLLLHALGFGAVDADQLWLLGRLLKTPLRTAYQDESAAIRVLHPVRVARSHPDINSILNKSVRNCLRPHAESIVPDKTRYTWVVDKLEILLTLGYVHTQAGTHPRDAFWYFQENGQPILNDIEKSLSSKRDESGFVRSNIFGNTADECLRRLEQVRKLIP